LDKEGHNFEDQFISLHKTRMRAIGNVDDHQDEVIDFREFYYKYDEENDRNLDRREALQLSDDEDKHEESKSRRTKRPPPPP
jgi:hypothetical protein